MTIENTGADTAATNAQGGDGFFVNAVDQQTEAIMAQALADHGLLNQTLANNPAQANADASMMMEAQIYAPASNISEYDFSGIAPPPPDSGVSSQEFAAYQQHAREVLKDSRIPASIGGDMMRRMFSTMNRDAVPEAQLQASHHSAMDYLSKIWGQDRDANVHLANLLVDRIDTRLPGFKSLLKHSGEGNNPMLIVALYNAARVNWSKG